MKRLFITILGISVCLAFYIVAGMAAPIVSVSGDITTPTDTPTDTLPLGNSGITDPDLVVTPAALPLQPVGTPFQDPVFGTTLRRVSNTSESGGFGTHIYSQLQAFSSDNVYLLLIENGNYVVRRMSDLSLVAGLDTSEWNDPRWHPTQPHTLVHFDTNADTIVRPQFTDVDTLSTTTVFTFPTQYERVRVNQSFDELSEDGRWLGGMVTRDDDADVMFALDIQNLTLGALLPLPDLYAGPCDPDPQWGEVEPDWVGVSPLGNYLVVQWQRDGTTRCSGLETFDLQSGAFVGRVYDGHQHGDLGVDSDGVTEFFMTFELYHPSGNEALGVRELPGTSTVSQPTYVQELDWIGDHISCQGPHGVCLVTTYDNEAGGWSPLEGELFLQYTDGSVLRLVHHRSSGCGYWVQPRASISRDGRYVVFASDWGHETGTDSCGGGNDLGAGDPYIVDLWADCDLPGDINCDCVVDIADIMLIARRWHSSVGDDDYDPLCDLDDSGGIDIVDIMLVAVHWGESCQDPEEGTWSPIGASGGGWLTAIAISSDDPDVIYVGCDVGGIYKTTDNGESWQIINNGLTNYYIQDIVIDPQTATAAATLYAATQGGVFKSTDGGDTWVAKRNGFPPVSRYAFSAPVAEILVDPANPNIIYAGVGMPHHEGHQGVYWLGVEEKGVIYKSTDYGETWTKIRNTGIDTNAMIYSMAMDPGDSSVLYVATEYGVYKSTDAGSTWQSKNAGLPHLHTRDIIIDPANSDVLYLTMWATPGSASWEGGVYKSTDAAESWVAKNNGLAKAMGDPSESTFLTSNYKNIVINPQNSQILYVANTSWWPEPGIFKTTDGGDNWTWVTRNEEPNINVDLGWIDWGPQAYCLAIDPKNPDRLLFGTDGVICKTEDAGGSWVQVYTDPVASAHWRGRGLEMTCVMDVAVDPTNPDNVYVGYCDIGFLKSTDGGGSFKKTESGMNYPANSFAIVVDPDNPNVLYTGTGDLLTWGTNQGEVCKSTDYGETWNVIGDPSNGLPDAEVWSLAINPNSNPDSRILYAASYQNGIYKTADGGVSWFPVNNGLGINRNIRKIVIDPTDSSTLYAGIEGYDEGLATVQGGVYKTSDGGQNWARIDTNPPQPSVLDLAIDPTDSNVIYSAAREHYDHTQQTMYLGGVYKSTDGGSHWTRLSSGFGGDDNLNVGALAINPQNPAIIYAGTFDDNFHDESSGRGIFKSTDGGANWTPMNDGLSILYTTVIAIDPSDHSRLYVGTHGNSVFTGIDD